METTHRNRATHRWSAFALGFAALTVITASAVSARAATPQERLAELGKAVETQLQGQRTEALHIVSDKPLYRPGEAIWFRVFEVDRKSLTTVTARHAVTVRLIGPSGAKVAEKRVLAQNGVATNDFALPQGMPGGAYRLEAQSDRKAKHSVGIQISTYQLPRVKKTLRFTRDSYEPGDFVVAEVDLFKATGEPLATRVIAVISLDERELGRLVRASNRKGRALIAFQVPPAAAKGELRLTLMVNAGGVTESLGRRVPVVRDDVKLSLFPEGGELVTGLESRVYFAATDSLGRPARVGGWVADDRGAVVARVESMHDGMGRFAITTKEGRSYKLRLNKPRGAKLEMALPAPRQKGCTLQSVDDFDSKRQQLRVQVRCTEAQPVLATAALRHKLLAHKVAQVPAGRPAQISLPLPRNVQGTVRVTLFDMDKKPLAERVVYRGLGSDVRVEVEADRDSYSPRDKVTLQVKTTDAHGRPVAADLAVAVVDDTVLNFADDDRADILSRLYLEPEMPGQTIEDPNFYFSDDPKAPEALDLLLGTKAYRRFEWQWVPKK